jgi:1-acyl-sn-glycerol-3-phosphate acyltransferase
MRHIPVDRDAGLAAYKQALAALKDGEVVGVFPEATISRSFTIKELKTGAARMAVAAGVPIVPMALWGSQRLWTKGRPRTLTRRHVPISIAVDQPLVPLVPSGSDGDAVTAELRQRMSRLLDTVQRGYPDQPHGPDDAWWQPAHLGGTAPTPEEAKALDAAR